MDNPENETNTKCSHEGCENNGEPCYLDPTSDEPDEYYCPEHAHAQGYCWYCGHFWGGVEAFDFAPSRLCPNCKDAIDADMGMDDEYWDEDDWDAYEDYEDEY
jgi:hypothetical protein